MAGIWNRIAGRQTESADPLASLMLSSMVYLVARNVFTAAQVRDAINATLREPLTVDEQADLSAIITNAGTGTATARIDYWIRVQSIAIVAEIGVLTNEALFRSELGLPA